jgi:hypothetical protein
MILRRVTARLREENWVAIAIDFLIVVVGVFLGIQASNWNQARLERREVERLLVQLQPELLRMRAVTGGRLDYYRTIDRFAQTALGGWAGDPKVGDRDFVIAAYQASQITGMRNDPPLLSMLSSEDVRKIDEPALRSALLQVINYNYEPLTASAMQTHYREDVRQIIPADIQAIVRRACGDYPLANGMPVLPTTCGVPISPDRAAVAADELRRHPELARELQFHLSQTGSFQLNAGFLDDRLARLEKLLEVKFGKPARAEN